MSNPIRYIPIPENSTAHPVIINSTFPRGNLTLNSTEALMNKQPQAGPLHFPFLVYYLFSAIVIAVILILAHYYGGGIHAPTRVIVQLGARERRSFIEAIYEYAGIKKILRSYYLRLREIFGCPSCTPRELALMSRDRRIYRFAEVYEDVVYGSKERSDVDEVVREIDKIRGGVGD